MLALIAAISVNAYSYAQSGPTASSSNAPSALPSSLPALNNDPNAQMLLQSDELVYNEDKNTVTARGGVQIFYNGYNVVADSVAYNRATKHLIAEGKVRITDPRGNIYHTASADLTDNFSSGFVRTLRLERTDKTRFAADSAERQNGNITILNRGVYTACEPCKNHPEKPPLWQVKAARIIHNEQEQTIYYEDAQLEFFGTPIAYLPYFWSPDGTVKRKSGFLTPGFFYNKRIGSGVSTPYYFALSPFYDLTVTPTFTAPQGPHLDALWQHKLPNGFYSIRASGINQFDPDDVGLGVGIDEGARTWRGSIETKGKFLLTDKWTIGWDISAESDQRYLKDYGYLDITTTERISTFYLQGIGDRSFFDARAYYIDDLVPYDPRDRQGLMPFVAPVIDHNKRGADPYFGGEFRIDSNFTNIHREDQFSYFLPSTGKYFTPGFAGDYTRATTEIGWRKTFTDPIGQRWTPFGSLRGDVYSFNVANNTTPDYDNLLTREIETGNPNLATLNDVIPGLITDDGDLSFRGMPTIGVDYRYPFIGTTGLVTHIVEPVAQVILRPNETRIGFIPNEDAQSLVFDDTNLFEVDKFSGYDRVEGGSRVNAGLQYTLETTSGFKASGLFGQSHHIGGRNSFAQGLADINGTGIDSGLDTDRSDYVARLYVQPWQYGDVAARFRFDEASWTLSRFELDGRVNFNPFAASMAYTRTAAQPNLGILTDREEVTAFLSYNLNENWSVYGGARFAIQGVEFTTNPLLSTKSSGFISDQYGVRYTDECFTMSVDYTTLYQDYGDLEAQRQLMLRFSLRTLGDGVVRTNLGAASQ